MDFFSIGVGRADFNLILPEVELALFGLGILLIDFWIDAKSKYWNAILALAGVGFSGVTLWMLRTLVAIRGEQAGFHGTILVDPFFIFFALIFLAATALVVLLSVRYLDVEDEHHGEYYALMLFAAVGMMFMASGIDLIVQFLGLETMAISFYVLTGFLRRDRRSNEAAMKYLLLGAFSSGILAYGFSLLYGMSGSTNVLAVGDALARRQQAVGVDVLIFLAFVTVAAGLFFKVAAVPFHQWAPDVYEGAPTTITAYVSVASKIASFALLLRIFAGVFWPSRDAWSFVVVAVALASLTIGNFAALTQTNVKRLMAYSSISHVGYILLGVVAAVTSRVVDGRVVQDFNETALLGIAYYLFVYAFMTIGAFAVIIVLRRKGLIGDELDDLNGLYHRSPAAAVLLLIFMLSLAGIPPTAGFVGKLFILQGLIETGHRNLAILGALYIVPSLFYYFLLVKHAWMRESSDPVRPVISAGQALALTVAVFLSLAAGIYPEPFTQLARYAFSLGR